VIVVDTNLVAYLLISGEHTEDARSAFRADPEWVAPSSWRVEFLNVLATYCRAGTLTVATAVEIYRRAGELVHDVPFDVDPGRVLDASTASGRSGYDCVFVVAAQMNNLPLVTFDRQLRAAFATTAILPNMIDQWFRDHRATERGQ